MRFLVEVDCSGEAFGEDEYDQCVEVAQVLERLAWSLGVDLDRAVTLWDSEGRECGRARFIPNLKSC